MARETLADKIKSYDEYTSYMDSEPVATKKGAYSGSSRGRKQTHIELLGYFEFGKYKGLPVEEVLEDNPGYFTWMADKGDWEFDEALTEELEKRKLI